MSTGGNASRHRFPASVPTRLEQVLSAVVNPAAMFEQTDARKLIEEIDRYLAAVDLFRAENCEPSWRPELQLEIAQATKPAALGLQPSDVQLH